MEKLELLIKEVEKEIQLLEKWAEDSLVGGWSTHQVIPQRQRAIELKALLYDINKKP